MLSFSTLSMELSTERPAADFRSGSKNTHFYFGVYNNQLTTRLGSWFRMVSNLDKPETARRRYRVEFASR